MVADVATAGRTQKKKPQLIVDSSGEGENVDSDIEDEISKSEVQVAQKPKEDSEHELGKSVQELRLDYI